ncbi:uncharacterized protein [Heliangelus exortis]|uniref:uncharacterized protein isoform X9 n=1 Tax=Heliangelus exortis TaxID=472823 RepID=UPI003A8CECD3
MHRSIPGLNSQDFPSAGATSTCSVNTSRNGGSPTALGSLSQCLASLSKLEKGEKMLSYCLAWEPHPGQERGSPSPRLAPSLPRRSRRRSRGSLTGALELCVTEQEALKQWLCGELQAQVIAEKTGVKPVDTLLFLLEEFIAPVLSAAQLAFIRKTKYFLFMHQKRVIIGFKEL